MRFTTISLAALATFAAAAPAENDPRDVAEVNMMATSVPQWTIQSMRRQCDGGDQNCHWTFGINNKQNPVQNCNFNIKAANGKPASQTNFQGVKCGFFTVSGGWSGQFGPGNGFTTLSVANYATRRIAYPAYTDKELAGGRIVSPNKSYTPQNF